MFEWVLNTPLDSRLGAYNGWIAAHNSQITKLAARNSQIVDFFILQTRSSLVAYSNHSLIKIAIVRYDTFATLKR